MQCEHIKYKSKNNCAYENTEAFRHRATSERERWNIWMKENDDKKRQKKKEQMQSTTITMMTTTDQNETVNTVAPFLAFVLICCIASHYRLPYTARMHADAHKMQSPHRDLTRVHTHALVNDVTKSRFYVRWLSRPCCFTLILCDGFDLYRNLFHFICLNQSMSAIIYLWRVILLMQIFSVNAISIDLIPFCW